MVNSIIDGKIYLRSGDSSLFKIKGVANVFTGMFGVSQGIPFYFLNVDDHTDVPNPTEICKTNKHYCGVTYLLDTPGLACPSVMPKSFSFSPDFGFLKTNRNLIPLSNVAYIRYDVNGVNYIAIPASSIASIEYNTIL